MNSTKNILSISYPIILTLVAQNVINVTDTAFLGRVSEVALGASAIAGVFYFAVYMVGFGFSQGVQILIGRRNGEENYSHIGPIFNNGLIFNLLLSVAIFFATVLWAPQLMKLLVSSDHIYTASMEYLNWRIYGFFFVFASVVFRAFYVGITDTKVLTTTAIVTAVVNIVLDYILIFGKFGFPEWGIAGAAIASVIAEAAGLVYLVLHTFVYTDMKKYALFTRNPLYTPSGTLSKGERILAHKSLSDINRSRLVENFKTIGQILNLSVFIMFQYFISISTWFLFFIFIERMGERPLAVTNIGRSMYILLMIPAGALATTANTLVSNIIGAGQKEEVLKTINKIAVLALLSVTPFIVFTFFFPELFAGIYTDDHSLMLASVPVIKVVSVAVAFFAVSNVIVNGVSGTGSTRTAFYIEVVTLFFYLSYVYFTSNVYPQPVEIVWMSEFVYWTLIAGLGYWFLKKGNWRKNEI